MLDRVVQQLQPCQLGGMAGPRACPLRALPGVAAGAPCAVNSRISLCRPEPLAAEIMSQLQSPPWMLHSRHTLCPSAGSREGLALALDAEEHRVARHGVRALHAAGAVPCCSAGAGSDLQSWLSHRRAIMQTAVAQHAPAGTWLAGAAAVNIPRRCAPAYLRPGRRPAPAVAPACTSLFHQSTIQPVGVVEHQGSERRCTQDCLLNAAHSVVPPSRQSSPQHIIASSDESRQ